MKLQATLIWIATRWVEEHHAAGSRVSLETLSSRASSDGKLFKRLALGRPMMLTTFESVVQYLANPKNWPDQTCPTDVLECVTDITPSLQLAA